jgi:hypothetical protein
MGKVTGKFLGGRVLWSIILLCGNLPWTISPLPAYLSLFLAVSRPLVKVKQFSRKKNPERNETGGEFE